LRDAERREGDGQVRMGKEWERDEREGERETDGCDEGARGDRGGLRCGGSETFAGDWKKRWSQFSRNFDQRWEN
jgi:hypothetical protein